LKTKGIYFLYRLLETLLFPVVAGYFLYRGLRNPAYFTSLSERLGRLPRSYRQTAAGAIWLHAVSVGEVISLQGLAGRLRQQYPRAPLFVSAGTLAGHAIAREKLGGIAAGIFYAPLDYAFAVRAVLRALRPALVIVAETEIWPNLFREVKRTGCGLLLLNGRISDRAAARYRSMHRFFRHVLRWPDAILVQSAAMRDRFIATGAPAGRVEVIGNLKYDFVPGAVKASPEIEEFLERARAPEIWIAASTMPPATASDPDEDDVVIAAFQELAREHAGLLLILAPRKPERFALAAEKLERAGIRFVRRSALAALSLPGVLLLDSIGELAGVFRFASVVFMGGTLVERGGHNILEPAFFARPVICGPHMENFRQIADDFRVKDAYVEIRTAAELAAAVSRLLADSKLAETLGARAKSAAESHGGATERALARIRHVEAAALPCFAPPLPARVILAPLAQLWAWGGAWKRARDLRLRRSLPTPVISVGNITSGGTGKTPFVLYVAARMKKDGHRCGIVTRGYGRQSGEKHLILEPGAQRPASQTGDEPQLFLQSGLAPVGIGADRFETGRLLAERFPLDVILMDDGFQHLRLDRRLDIVLIDAIDPFGDCALLPRGRLREPLDSLARAGIFVITRSDCGRALDAIEKRLREYNARASIFRASVIPEYWVEHASGRRVPLEQLASTRVGAFCGLGNPQSFWSTLENLGIKPVDRIAFPDHHRYGPDEMRAMAKRFAAAVTTEKDAINLPESAGLSIYWLKIRCQVEREAEFAAVVESRLTTEKGRV
jgi:3-deoxy-D-manno-octulosonic-acid transferase